jgi:GH18 family chitinase
LRRLIAACTALAEIATLMVAASAFYLQPESRASHPMAVHQGQPRQQIHMSPGKPSREVFGYALSGSLGDPNWGYSSWNWSLLTTVAYFGLRISDDGSIVSDSGWATWNSSLVTAMMSTAHASSTKVVVTLILHDFSPGNPDMCAGLANRATTVAQAVATVRARGADGVNVDYEGLNGVCPNGDTGRAMMTDFVAQLRAALGTASYLSVATYAGAATDSLGFFDIAAMSPYADSFFVMAYDLEYANYLRAPIYCASFCLGPTAPLAGYYYNDTSIAAQYAAVVPASQVILGVPYYGRKSCVVSAALNPYPMTSVTADTYLDAVAEITDPSVRPGSYVSRIDTYDPAGQERWNTWFNTSLNCERELYIDDPTSLGKKYDLVNADGLRGVGIWALNYGGGSPELWSTLNRHFSACLAVTASAIPLSATTAANNVTISAAASGCANPLYEFWVLPPGGIWTVAQAYSSSPSFKWVNPGKAAGAYRFSVWARDANSLNSYDAFSAFAYTIIPTCSAVSAATIPLSATTVGNNVTITAAATGCPSPLYEFWVLPPGGTWTLAQSYTSSPSFKWVNSGKSAGSYRFSVWVRDAGSPGATGSAPYTYDAFSAFAYTIIPTCSTIDTSTIPSSATTAPNNVTITAVASGCPNPLYEFWILPPGGAWTLAQAYSSSPSFKWMDAAKAAGAYRFSIWVRDATSPGAAGRAPYSYDTFSAFAYTIIPTCSGITASTVPMSATTVGNNVTITAAASGCPSPTYEFWFLPPGGTWTLARAYSGIPSFKWVSAGRPAGSYRFSVWARDAGSPGASGNSPYNYDAFSAFNYTLI